MLTHLIRRLLYAVPIAFGVTLVSFLLAYIAPGDPLNAIAPADAPAEVIATLRATYGLDRPLPVRYLLWLDRAVRGDLGASIASGRSVTGEVMAAVRNTLVLAFVAALVGVGLGCVLGAVAGVKKGSAIDRIATTVSVIGVSVPHYWLGLVLTIVFSVKLGWLPAMGAGGESSAWTWGDGQLGDHLRHIVLPAATLSVIPLGIVTRTVRALVADALGQEFVVALRARGLREFAVLRHVARNAAPTVLAVAGLQVGYLMGGSILVETVFAWPGTGFLLNTAIFQRDIPLLQGTILVLCMFFVALNLLVDLLQPLIDPPHRPRMIEARSYGRGVWLRLRRDPVAMVSAAVLLAIVVAAVFAPWLAPADPFKTSMIRRLLPIGSEGFPLGTDELGRDMVSRLMYGGRQSLVMGVLPVAIAFVLGTAIGLFAGYVGGAINSVIMRTLDVFYAFPSVLLAVAISGALGPGMNNSLIALTLVFLPQVVRVAESVTAQVRHLEYIDAARMSGAGALSVMRHHLLGNVIGTAFVYAAGLVSVCMILASGLSFLGLGVRPPEPEWGLMLNTLRSAIYLNPWVAALPGALIFVTSIAFNLLSDGVRSAMDPKR